MKLPYLQKDLDLHTFHRPAPFHSFILELEFVKLSSVKLHILVVLFFWESTEVNVDSMQKNITKMSCSIWWICYQDQGDSQQTVRDLLSS